MTSKFKNLYYFFYRFFSEIRYIHRKIYYFYQKRIRGFSDRDLWSLDHTFAKFIIPRLKKFKENLYGFPLCFIEEIDPDYWDHENFIKRTDDQQYEIDTKIKNIWISKIDSMIRAFELIVSDNADLDYSDLEMEFLEGGRINIKKDEQKEKIRNSLISSRDKEIEIGLNNFSKHFRSLWD